MPPLVLFADFEAFQHGDEPYRIKELCILSADRPLKPLYFLFRAYKPWDKLTPEQQRTYSYVERKLHHLAWGEGNTRYCANCITHYVEKSLLHTAAAGEMDHVCYVLGKQKADFLQRELPTLNIVEYNFTSLKQLPDAALHLTCCYRADHSREHCAVLKCYRLLSHYSDNVQN